MSKSDEVSLLSTRWMVFTILSVLMISAGLVLLMEAAIYRMKEMEVVKWGTVLAVAIVLFNAGISFLGSSIKYRIYLDRKRKQESEFKPSSSGHRSSHSSGSRSRRGSTARGYDE